MRPVQTLYYDHGQMYCPNHGNKFIRFMSDDGAQPKLYWCCAAMLPDGAHCMHSAEWSSISDILDPDVEVLAIAHMRSHFG